MSDALVIPLITPGSRQAERHQLVVLSRHRRRLRFPRRGDRVEVQGRPEILRYRDRDGTSRMIHQVVVERLRVLESGPALNRSIVLTGYLGNRPEIRLNRERDFTRHLGEPRRRDDRALRSPDPGAGAHGHPALHA